MGLILSVSLHRERQERHDHKRRLVFLVVLIVCMPVICFMFTVYVIERYPKKDQNENKRSNGPTKVENPPLLSTSQKLVIICFFSGRSVFRVNKACMHQNLVYRLPSYRKNREARFFKLIICGIQHKMPTCLLV